MGSFPSKASTPCASPESTSLLNRRFASVPFICSQLSPFSRRQDMHQQPPQAPLAPNSFSKSLHNFGLNSLVSIFIPVSSLLASEDVRGLEVSIEMPTRVLPNAHPANEHFRSPSAVLCPRAGYFDL